jgi:hypothetical protein
VRIIGGFVPAKELEASKSTKVDQMMVAAKYCAHPEDSITMRGSRCQPLATREACASRCSRYQVLCTEHVRRQATCADNAEKCPPVPTSQSVASHGKYMGRLMQVLLRDRPCCQHIVQLVEMDPHGSPTDVL